MSKNSEPITRGVALDRDVPVPMRDGVHLMANIFRPGHPLHTHRQRQPVQPGEIVPVEIEILASSTYFEAGASLRLDVLGHDAARYPAFRHGQSVNSGEHAVHAGGRYPSVLLTPFVNR